MPISSRTTVGSNAAARAGAIAFHVRSPVFCARMKPLLCGLLFILFLPGLPPSSGAQTRAWFPLDESPPGSPAEVLLLPVASSENQTVFDVIIHGFWGETRLGPDGITYTKIDIPGLQNLGQVGAPHLPIARELVAVPTDPAAVTFAGMIPLSTAHTYMLHLWPEPVPARQGETEIPEVFTLDPAVYGSPLPFPANAGSGNPVNGQEPVPNVPVEVYPCRWTPAADQLEIYARSRWQFDHAGAVRTFQPITRDRARMCMSLVFNWNIVDAHFPGNHAQYQGEYLFVYPSIYFSSIKAMIAQKKARGFTIGQIVTDTLGVVTAAAVKTAVTNWYLGTPANADHYCLIAGEATRIPPFNLGTDLNPEWSDDMYGYINNNWYARDIYVGRLAPADSTDLRRQVTKILNYEDHPVASPVYYRYVMLVSHRDSEFQQAQETVRMATYAVAPIFDTYYGSNPANNNAGVTSRVNSGEGITCYRGHGGPKEWYNWNLSSQSYRYSDVDLLANGPLTTVIWTIACNNSDLYDLNGIGLHWMSRFPGGAVSHYGATVPSNHDPNDELEIRLFEAVWDKGVTGQGLATSWAEVKMTLADSQHGGFNAMVYTLLGDPEMHIRREGPPNWALDFPLHLPILSNGQKAALDVRVRNELGAPVDALVSVWKPASGAATASGSSDEIVDNRYTASDGWAHFLVTPQSGGFVYLTVRDTTGNGIIDSIAVDITTGVGENERPGRPFHSDPSVSRGTTRWVFESPAAPGTTVSIFAVDGRCVATLPIAAGSRDVVWAGTNDRGERVASGVYVAGVHSKRKNSSARVVIVR
jgi:Peptidase family C25